VSSTHTQRDGDSSSTETWLVREEEDVQSKVFDNYHEARIEEMLMAKARRNESPNDDLIKAVQDHTDQIIEFYEEVEYDRPVIVLDFQRQQLRAYPYETYEVMLSKESQAVLAEEYEKAIANDKVLVLAWDSATGRLVNTTFDHD
jgi:hypothetical protein